MPSAVVLGASGGLGSATVRCLLERKTELRVVGRELEPLEAMFPDDAVEVMEADPFNHESLAEACEGAETVYLCVNMAYPLWEQWPALMESVLSAVRGAGARLVFPTNVYSLGRQQRKPVAEDAPRNPHTKKGRIRMRLEDMVLEAGQTGDIPGLIIRFPDFYGPRVRNTLVDSMFLGAPQGSPMLWAGDPDLPHEFIYSDDAAEAMVRLAERPDAYGQVWHVPGPGSTSARQWTSLLEGALGRKVAIRRIRDWQVRLVGLVDPATREFAEMLYLWQTPILLDGSKYTHHLGPYPATPYAEGIRRTLAWLKREV